MARVATPIWLESLATLQHSDAARQAHSAKGPPQAESRQAAVKRSPQGPPQTPRTQAIAKSAAIQRLASGGGPPVVRTPRLCPQSPASSSNDASAPLPESIERSAFAVYVSVLRRLEDGAAIVAESRTGSKQATRQIDAYGQSKPRKLLPVEAGVDYLQSSPSKSQSPLPAQCGIDESVQNTNVRIELSPSPPEIASKSCWDITGLRPDQVSLKGVIDQGVDGYKRYNRQWRYFDAGLSERRLRQRSHQVDDHWDTWQNWSERPRSASSSSSRQPKNPWERPYVLWDGSTSGSAWAKAVDRELERREEATRAAERRKQTQEAVRIAITAQPRKKRQLCKAPSVAGRTYEEFGIDASELPNELLDAVEDISTDAVARESVHD